MLLDCSIFYIKYHKIIYIAYFQFNYIIELKIREKDVKYE